MQRSIVLLLAATCGSAASASAADPEIDRKAGSACASATLKPTGGVGFTSFGSDRNVAIPTLFSWKGGTPTATATRTACGVFTNGKDHADGFALTVALPPQTREVIVFVGSYKSAGWLNATLLAEGGAVLGSRDKLIPQEVKANGVGNAALSIRWAASADAAPASLLVTWTVASGDNLQFAAVAIRSTAAAGPCATPMCAAVTTCAGNCPTVELDAVGDLDWMHAGVVSAYFL